MSDVDLLVEPARALPEPRQLTPGLTTGDRVFRFLSAASAAGVLVILGLVATFLVIEAQPALKVVGSSMFIAGIVVGLMVLPIIASVTREVLSQAPRGVCEAALALGGSRWGMIRSVILPFGRSGIVGAAMLGLGRALGETIAIALILAFNFKITTQVLAPGGGSVAGLIANNFGEAGDAQRHALVAAGLALFVITLVVNTV